MFVKTYNLPHLLLLITPHDTALYRTDMCNPHACTGEASSKCFQDCSSLNPWGFFVYMTWKQKQQAFNPHELFGLQWPVVTKSGTVMKPDLSTSTWQKISHKSLHLPFPQRPCTVILKRLSFLRGLSEDTPSLRCDVNFAGQLGSVNITLICGPYRFVYSQFSGRSILFWSFTNLDYSFSKPCSLNLSV